MPSPSREMNSQDEEARNPLPSRVEIISAVLIRLTSGSDSSLLAILSVSRSFARKLFLYSSFPSQSLPFIICIFNRVPIFRASLTRRYITYDICILSFSPLIDKHDTREHAPSNSYISSNGRCRRRIVRLYLSQSLHH